MYRFTTLSEISDLAGGERFKRLSKIFPKRFLDNL